VRNGSLERIENATPGVLTVNGGARPSLEILRQDFERHLRLTLAKDRYTATGRDRYFTLALTVRDRLIERWIATRQTHHKKNVKRITVGGALKGAQGGEPIVVSARRVGSTSWSEQVVTAGANGGRFTATFNVSGPAEFVARWAGDSGRQGAGSSVLTVTLRK